MPGADDFLAKARAGWGAEMPVWIHLLAEYCAMTSMRTVSARLGLAHSTVSKVMHRTYRGNYRNVENAFTAQFGDATVYCQALDMDLDAFMCLEHQRTPNGSMNSAKRMMYAACRRCPRFRGAP